MDKRPDRRFPIFVIGRFRSILVALLESHALDGQDQAAGAPLRRVPGVNAEAERSTLLPQGRTARPYLAETASSILPRYSRLPRVSPCCERGGFYKIPCTLSQPADPAHFENLRITAFL